MTHRRSSPEVAGAVQARLADLRRRKAVLDDLIRCLENYADGGQVPLEMDKKAEEIGPQLAGAA